jgi:catechol 2,3-dioxygenase-like lactoylglutathione lyase family enzyme
MITGAHAIIYSDAADEVRAFLRDVLGFAAVDAGGGWLVFALPPSEVAVHPMDGEGKHELYLMCDDIEATITELSAKGVTFTPVSDQGWGRLTSLTLPGGSQLGLYQPQHPTAI